MRIGVVAIALSMASGLVLDAGSTQPPGKDQNLSGTTGSSKRMANGKGVDDIQPQRQYSVVVLLRGCGIELPSVRPIVYMGIGAARMSVAGIRMAFANRRRMASAGEALS